MTNLPIESAPYPGGDPLSQAAIIADGGWSVVNHEETEVRISRFSATIRGRKFFICRWRVINKENSRTLATGTSGTKVDAMRAASKLMPKFLWRFKPEATETERALYLTPRTKPISSPEPVRQSPPRSEAPGVEGEHQASATHLFRDRREADACHPGGALPTPCKQVRRSTSGDEPLYRIHRRAKRSGGFRTIYVPCPSRMADLRSLVPDLNAIQRSLCGPWVHGFFPGRSPVTNAKAHVGQAWTLTADLSDFFDSVQKHHLEHYLRPEVLDLVLVDGATRQGLPTSPPCANIAAIAMDAEITSRWPELVYTRYADDLTFSGSTKDALGWIVTDDGIIAKDFSLYDLD